MVESGTERLEDIVFVGGLSVALWTSGRAVAVRELREEVLRQRADQLAEEAEWRAEAAVAGERARIARELHDLMAHSVSVMVLHAGGVRRALGDEHEEERRALLTVEKAGREALDDMHRVVGVLRKEPEAAPRGPQPRMADADELLAPARAAGLTAEIRVVGIPRALPPGIDVSAGHLPDAGYRVAAVLPLPVEAT